MCVGGSVMMMKCEPLGLSLHRVIFLQPSTHFPGEQAQPLPSSLPRLLPCPQCSHLVFVVLEQLAQHPFPRPPSSHCSHLVIVMLERLAQPRPLFHEVLAALVCDDNKGEGGIRAASLHR